MNVFFSHSKFQNSIVLDLKFKKSICTRAKTLLKNSRCKLNTTYLTSFECLSPEQTTRKSDEVKLYVL